MLRRKLREALKKIASPFDKALYDLGDLNWYIDRQKKCYLVTPNNYGIDIGLVEKRLYENEENPEEISKIHAEILIALDKARKDRIVDWTTKKAENISNKANEAYQRALLACENRTRLDTNDWGGVADLTKIRDLNKCLELATTYSQYKQAISQFNKIAETHENKLKELDKELEEKIERLAQREAAQREKEKQEREEKQRVINERNSLLHTANGLIFKMERYTSNEFVQISLLAACSLSLDDLKDHIKQLEADLKKYQDEQHASQEQKEKTEAAKMRLIERGKGLIAILNPKKSNTIDDLDKAAAQNDNLVSLTKVVNALAFEFETANLSRPVFFTPDKKSKSPWWGQGMHKPEKHEDQEQGRELLVYQDRSRKI